MVKSLHCLVAVLCVLSISGMALAAATVVGADGIVNGEVASGQRRVYEIVVPEGAERFRVSVQPCFGPVDWSLRQGEEPTDEESDFVWTFPENTHDHGDEDDHDDHDDHGDEDDQGDHDERSTGRRSTDTVEWYALATPHAGSYFVAVQAHEEYDASFLLVTHTTASVTPLPALPANARITTSAAEGGELTLSWEASAEEHVRYCVYGHSEEDFHADTDVHASACWIVDRPEALLGCTPRTEITLHNLAPAGNWHMDVVVQRELGNRQASAYDSFEAVVLPKGEGGSSGLGVGPAVAIAIVATAVVGVIACVTVHVLYQRGTLKPNVADV